MRGKQPGRSAGCRVVLHGCLLQESLELTDVAGAFGRCKAFQSLGAIANGCHEFVRRGEARVGDVFVTKLYRVAEAFVVRDLDVALVCSVVVGGSIEVPTVH